MRLLNESEYRQRIINVLFEIDRICRENNLRYMVFYGTLLGAIRHKGMIPWDDDIDIVMPRADYTRFGNLVSRGNYCINFIDIDHSKDTIFPHGKVCDINTIMREKHFRKVENYGAFVDVFPLDYAPNDEELRLKEKAYIRKLIIFEAHCARTGFDFSDSFKTNILRIGAFLLSRFVSPQFMLRKINNYMLARNTIPTNYYRVFGGGIFPVEWLDSFSEVEFEGRLLLAPKDPDIVLKKCFGDYMKLPPVEERKHAHNLFCYEKD